MQKLLQFAKACCQFAYASVASTSFGSMPGPSTTYVGVKTSGILQYADLSCIGREKERTVLDDRVWSYVNSSCTWSRVLQEIFRW